MGNTPSSSKEQRFEEISSQKSTTSNAMKKSLGPRSNAYQLPEPYPSERVSWKSSKLFSVQVSNGEPHASGAAMLTKTMQTVNMELYQSWISQLENPHFRAATFLLTPQAIQHHCDIDSKCVSFSYLRGTSLAELLEKGKEYSLQEACKIILSLTSSLRQFQELHDPSFIHGNLKPENIIFVGELWKLSDQSSIERLSLIRQKLGRKALFKLNNYLPHEVSAKSLPADTKEIAKKLGVFSLGLVMLEMLGTPKEELPFAFLKKRAFEKKKATIINHWSRRNQSVAELLEKTLTRKPENRFSLRDFERKLVELTKLHQQLMFHKKPVVLSVDKGFYTGSIMVMELSRKSNNVYLGCKDGSVYVVNMDEMRTIWCFKAVHTDWVASLAVDAEEKYLVTGSHDLTLSIINLIERRIIKTLRNYHERPISSICFSKLGNFCVTASYDQHIKMIDIPSGELFHVFWNAHDREISSIDITPDDKYLVSGSFDRSIRIKDILTRTHFYTFKNHHQDMINVLKVTRDGKYIVSAAGDKTIIVTDFHERVKKYTFYAAHANWISSISLSADSKLIASCSRDGTTMVRNLLAYENMQQYKTEFRDSATSVALSNDQRYLLTALQNSSLNVMQMNTLQSHQFGNYHKGAIKSVHITSAGKYIITCSEDNSLKVYDTEKDECVKTFRIPKKDVKLTCLSRDGKQLAVAVVSHKTSSNSLWILSVKDLRLIQKLKLPSEQGAMNCMAFSENDKEIIFTRDDKTIDIISLSKKKPIKTLANVHSGAIKAIVVTKNNLIISADCTGSLLFTELQTLKSEEKFSGLHSSPILSLALSPDEKFLATGDSDGTVNILDLQNTRIFMRFPNIDEGKISSLSFLSNKLFAYGSNRGVLKLINLQKRSPFKSIDTPHGLEISAMTYSKDGRLLVTGGKDHHISMMRI